MEAERTVAELERFLADRGDQLLRTATLLAGSREAGEDLLQTGLERLLRHWAAIDGNPRLRVAIAAGTVATLAAGAVTAAGATGAFVSAATTPIQTTAYVLKQVDKALAPAGVASLISVSRTLDTPGERIKPFEGGPAGALPGLSPAWTVTSTMSWVYQGTSKFSYYGPAGQPVFDVKLSTSSSAVTQTTVVYRDRTWWTAEWSRAPPPRPPGAVWLLGRRLARHHRVRAVRPRLPGSPVIRSSTKPTPSSWSRSAVPPPCG